MEDNRKRKMLRIAGVLVIILLAVDVVLLTIQNRALKETIVEMRHPPDYAPLSVGAIVPDMTLRMPTKDSVEIRYGNPAICYVFFVFSTTCPHCEASIPIWNELATREDVRHCLIFGISLSDSAATDRLISSSDIRFFPVLGDTSFIRKYRTYSVPQTMVINGEGMIEGIWVGEFTRVHSQELITVLRRTILPGSSSDHTNEGGK